MKRFILVLLSFSILILSGCSEKYNKYGNNSHNNSYNKINTDNLNDEKIGASLSEKNNTTEDFSKKLIDKIKERDEEEAGGDAVEEESLYVYYSVVDVNDDGNILLNINNKNEYIGLLGVNFGSTLFSDNPDLTTVEYKCFEEKSLNKIKEILDGKKVRLEIDPGGNFNILGDKLFYVYLEDGTFVNEFIIKNGYTTEWHFTSYKYESEFKSLEKKAKDLKIGLWENGICEYRVNQNNVKSCVIKGNINYNTGEKIYHLPGCEFYNETIIDERYEEKWFCTEEEAINAGWRKSYTCP